MLFFLRSHVLVLQRVFRSKLNLTVGVAFVLLVFQGSAKASSTRGSCSDALESWEAISIETFLEFESLFWTAFSITHIEEGHHLTLQTQPLSSGQIELRLLHHNDVERKVLPKEIERRELSIAQLNQMVSRFGRFWTAEHGFELFHVTESVSLYFEQEEREYPFLLWLLFDGQVPIDWRSRVASQIRPQFVQLARSYGRSLDGVDREVSNEIKAFEEKLRQFEEYDRDYLYVDFSNVVFVFSAFRKDFQISEYLEPFRRTRDRAFLKRFGVLEIDRDGGVVDLETIQQVSPHDVLSLVKLGYRVRLCSGRLPVGFVDRVLQEVESHSLFRDFGTWLYRFGIKGARLQSKITQLYVELYLDGDWTDGSWKRLFSRSGLVVAQLPINIEHEIDYMSYHIGVPGAKALSVETYFALGIARVLARGNRDKTIVRRFLEGVGLFELEQVSRLMGDQYVQAMIPRRSIREARESFKSNGIVVVDLKALEENEFSYSFLWNLIASSEAEFPDRSRPGHFPVSDSEFGFRFRRLNQIGSEIVGVRGAVIGKESLFFDDHWASSQIDSHVDELSVTGLATFLHETSDREEEKGTLILAPIGDIVVGEVELNHLVLFLGAQKVERLLARRILSGAALMKFAPSRHRGPKFRDGFTARRRLTYGFGVDFN